jgi:EH_Signature domain
MNLRELVIELKSSRKVIRPPQLPVKLALEESYQRLAEKYDQIGSINILDYRVLLEKLKAAADANSLRDLSYRDMRLAASCLFEGRPRLVDNLLFLRLYLDGLRSLRSRLAIKRLIHSYCLHFDPADQAIRRVGEFLQIAIREVKGQWDWPDRQRKYWLFDVARAPQELANVTAKNPKPREELEKLGLTGQLTFSGLSAYAYLHALRTIQLNLEQHQNIEDVNRAIAWARAEDGALLYSAYRSKLVNALLLPFVERDPTDEVHARVQTFLLEVLNDPRIDKAQ